MNSLFQQEDFPWLYFLIPVGSILLLIVLASSRAMSALADLPDPLGFIVALGLAVVFMGVQVWAVIKMSEGLKDMQRKALARDTGRSLESWVELVLAQGPKERDELMAWLKVVHGVSESDAHYILASRGRLSNPPEVREAMEKRQQRSLLGCIVGLMVLIVVAATAMMLFVR
jgi:hypothetical protein